MGDPYQVPIRAWKGLDLRLTAEGSAPNVLRVANNVDLSTGGGLHARDQLRQVATVDATALGLYVGAGLLRCAVPLTGGAIPSPPPGVTYDYFSNAAAGQTNGALELAGAQMWGNAPYLCVKRYVDIANTAFGFEWEHHYCPTKLVTDLPGTVTRVTLPFTPGPQLYKFVNKIWSHDVNTNDVWYSSSINGPTDWTNSGDAGYLPVSRQVTGNPILRGFSQYGAKLALFFSDSVQFWAVNTDPADNELADIVQGAGSENTKSIVDMGGNTVYFSNGGFRTVAAVAVTGEKNDSDIGANIYPETMALDLTGKTPISIWSANRSQLLCAIGAVVYVYTNSPQSGVAGWTKYTLPVTVEAMVEQNKIVYIRAGTAIYKFDSTHTGEAGYTWAARTSYQHGNTWGAAKSWFSAQYAMTGTCGTRFYVDSRDEAKINTGPSLTNSHYGVNKVALAMVAPCIALEFYGTAAWTMDACVLHVRDGNL